MEGVAEEEAEPRARVGAGVDDELAGDDPDRLGDQEARDERDQELPRGPALRSGGCNGRHSAIQLRLAGRRKRSYH